MTAQKARDALNPRSPEFLLYHPDKSQWSELDHHVRFIVQVVKDNTLGNASLWDESDAKRKTLEIPKAVYEVLIFLRATQNESGQSPPGYEA
jgi:hypothetical protein